MIGIVLLNYNEWDITIKCIESIRETCICDYRIYLVDNCSIVPKTEEFVIFLKKSNDIFFIENKRNAGYSAGNNLGILKARQDLCNYILISNNDVIFKADAIETMKCFLERNSDYGIVGPMIYTSDGMLQEINMGCKMNIWGKYKYILRKTPFSFLTKKYVEKFHAQDKDLKIPFDVFAVSGCCFMVAMCAFDALFPLDENTFLYEEENIIGCRMENAGLKTCYNTNCQIIHMGEVTTRHFSSFGYGCMVESEIYYCTQYLHVNMMCLIPLIGIRSIMYFIYYGKNGYRDYQKKIINALKRFG